MSATILLPRILQVGADASLELANILQQQQAKNILFITDPTILKLGYLEPLEKLLKDAQISYETFSETEPEPTIASLLPAVKLIQQRTFDAIVAIGGGSPIDSAKALSVLGRYGGKMADYRFPRIINEPGIPVIAIPTTAGTGSEVTRVTIITDEKTQEKMLCVGVGFMPVAALVDYKLTLSLPARTTADTGIDALTHAIEAYVSRKASAYTNQQALAAMKLIAPHLRTVYHQGKNEHAREQVMLGATLAGIAFSNASVALVHGMSRPIGAFFHVPHGLSNAMLLPAITEFSIPAAAEAYADCAKAMGLVSVDSLTDEANNALLNELKALNKELAVPSFSGFGIQKNEYFNVIETMAVQAKASGSPGNNPRIPTHQEMVMLYEQVWC